MKTTCTLLLAAVLMLAAHAVPAATLAVTDDLLLHLDGSDVTVTGGLVDSWNDQAVAVGGANDFTQSGAARPTVVAGGLNGHDTVDFNGSGQYLRRLTDSAFDTTTGHWTSILVQKADDDPVGTAQIVFRHAYDDISTAAGNQGNDALWGSFIQNDIYEFHARKESGSYVGASTGSIGDTGWHVQVGVTQALVDPSIQQFFDGVRVDTDVSDTTPWMTGHRRSHLGAQSTASPGNYFDGQLAEVLLYKRALSFGERRDVEDYLHAKYFQTGPSRLKDLSIVDDLRLLATMDDGDVSGTTVADVAGMPQNGTIVGQPGITTGNPGQMGQAVDFVGNDSDSINFGDVMNPGTGSFTVSLWFNADDVSGTEMIAGKGNASSADPGWSIWMGDDDLFVRGQQSGAGLGDRFGQWLQGVVTAGDWHHVAMVIDRDADTIRGYLDGSNAGWVAGGGGAVTDSLVPGSTIENTTDLLVGRRSTAGAPFAGLVDDFAIWDRALSASEIGYVYNKGLAGISVAAVPEPATALLLALGGLALAAIGRRRRSAA